MKLTELVVFVCFASSYPFLARLAGCSTNPCWRITRTTVKTHDKYVNWIVRTVTHSQSMRHRLCVVGDSTVWLLVSNGMPSLNRRALVRNINKDSFYHESSVLFLFWELHRSVCISLSSSICRIRSPWDHCRDHFRDYFSKGLPEIRELFCFMFLCSNILRVNNK